MKSARVCQLHYSPLISVPVVGYVVLLVNIVLFKLQLIESLYLSDKEKIGLSWLVSLFDSHQVTFLTKTFKLGFVLSYLHQPIKLDVQASRELTITTEQDYQAIVWSLVLAEEVSAKTRSLLSQHFHQDFASLFSNPR